MDEDIIGNIIVIVAIILFMLGSIYLRRRTATGKTEPETVASLLSEVEQNLKLVDAFSFRLKTKKFKTGSWNRNKARLDFLDQDSQSALARAFGIAEESNQKIDDAKKHKSSSYLASIELDKLKDTMTKSKQELERWLQENKDKTEMFPKRHGVFG